MPIVLTPDVQPRLTVTASGDLTVADLAAFLRCERARDRRYGPVWLDATAARTTMSAADVEYLANLLIGAVTRSGPRGPLAIIAADDDLFGLLQVLQVLCQRRGIDVRVFRADAAAEEWLVAR
jgi:hypothetical protein